MGGPERAQAHPLGSQVHALGSQAQPIRIRFSPQKGFITDRTGKAYGREIDIKFSGNSSVVHSCSQRANCQRANPSKLETSVAFCCVTKLHILEWPCMYVMIML